jgi:hypothetical protein
VTDEAPPPQRVSGVGGIESEEAFGEHRVHEDAPEEWLVDGYRRAVTRFRSVPQDPNNPELPRDTFIPLFEALAFAGSLIERVLEPKQKGDTRTTEEKLSTLQGVRYVRNRLIHQWALALVGRDVPQPRILTATGGSRLLGPTVVFDWFWRPLAELPLPDTPDKLGRESYVKHLEEKPARQTLEEVERALQARGGG